MKKSINLLLASLVCVLLAQYPRAESADAATAEEDTTVKVVLTRLDVNDQTLEVGLKIINNTDHDVWVCNGYERSGGSICYFSRFMDKDDKTLVLRRQYNRGLRWLERGSVPRNFRYLRLRPGQEKIESHSFTLPVTPESLFTASQGNAESAKRLAIEIGFYDEDLRALILGVVDMAERIGYDDSALSEATRSAPQTLYYRFFGGFTIAQMFKNITYFRDSVMSDSDEILTPAMEESLNGEQVLRINVDDVSIPYKSNYPPLASQGAKSTKDRQSRDTNKSSKDKPTREKG